MRRRFIPVTNSPTSPMAATSAAMLSVIATSRKITTPLRIMGGNDSLMLAASPLPVTRPMRLHIDWMETINGKERGMVQSMFRPNWAPACE